MVTQCCKSGIFHNNDADRNQDVVFSAENRNYITITLADGVSSCKEARNGAQAAGRAVMDLLLLKGSFFLTLGQEKRAELVVSHLQYELQQHASQAGRPFSEYASTVAGILLEKKTKRMLLFNLGDSLILSVQNGMCKILSMPSDSAAGCPVTTTKGAARLARTGVFDASFMESVLICSDGAWKNMFDRNYLRKDVKQMLLETDYKALAQFLQLQNCYDDYSFISLDIKKRNRRPAA